MASRSDRYERRLTPLGHLWDELVIQRDSGHHPAVIARVMGVDIRQIQRLIAADRDKLVRVDTWYRLESALSWLDKMPPVRATARRVAVDPYRNRLRRMGAAGWNPKQIIAELGVGENVLRDRAGWLSPEDASAFDAFFARVGDRGPEACGSTFCRASAVVWRKRGYIPPAAATAADMLPLPLTVQYLRTLSAAERRTLVARAEKRLA